jgi:plasmid maintenance system killer protein
VDTNGATLEQERHETPRLKDEYCVWTCCTMAGDLGGTRICIGNFRLEGISRGREFAAGKRVKAFSGFERSARLKLDRMEAATSLRDLAALPGNRFEALVGDRKGQYSIRIND